MGVDGSACAWVAGFFLFFSFLGSPIGFSNPATVDRPGSATRNHHSTESGWAPRRLRRLCPGGRPALSAGRQPPGVSEPPPVDRCSCCSATTEPTSCAMADAVPTTTTTSLRRREDDVDDDDENRSILGRQPHVSLEVLRAASHRLRRWSVNEKRVTGQKITRTKKIKGQRGASSFPYRRVAVV